MGASSICAADSCFVVIAAQQAEAKSQVEETGAKQAMNKDNMMKQLRAATKNNLHLSVLFLLGPWTICLMTLVLALGRPTERWYSQHPPFLVTPPHKD